MKRKFAILAAFSTGVAFGLGGCIRELLFVVAPILT